MHEKVARARVDIESMHRAMVDRQLKIFELQDDQVGAINEFRRTVIEAIKHGRYHEVDEFVTINTRLPQRRARGVKK